MKRRSFLQSGGAIAAAGLLGPDRARGADGLGDPRSGTPAGGPAAIDGRTSRISSADLTPYQPRPDKPWDARRAGHLLRRAGFGAAWSQIAAALTSTPDAVVQGMLAAADPPAPPGSWVSQTPFTTDTAATQAQYATWLRDLQEWWVTQMLKPAGMLREKMVLFWHNHFVSEFPTVQITQYCYIQNQLFRANAFGDFRELATSVTIDPAMLIYLNGADNKAGNPNENYARELLELFTLGRGEYSNGTPHYTEQDVIQLARALTGWSVNNSTLSGEFRPARFDGGTKTILGSTANFGVAGKTSDDVIALIFNSDDPDAGAKRAAVFICSKLYQFFVYDVPDAAIVTGMARTLVQNGWRIGAVLRQLLTSEHFFDDNVIGARIKSPAEFVLGSIHELALAPTFARANTDQTRPETHDPVMAMGGLAQLLFYPPNVKGWVGGHSWISSATVPLRIRYSKLWIEPIPGSLAYGFDPVAFVKALPDNTQVRTLLAHLIDLLLPFDVSDNATSLLLDELLAGGAEYDWNPDAPNAAARIRACLVRMTGLAEYQLL